MAVTHWHVHEDVAIRAFPRCGSTSCRATFGQYVSPAEALSKPYRVFIFRDPTERLQSVWRNYIKYDKRWRQTWGYPLALTDINDFVRHVLDKPESQKDWHIRSMSQLIGDLIVREDQAFTLEEMASHPPHGLPPLEHRNYSEQRPDAPIDPALMERYYVEYGDDYLLWNMAAEMAAARKERRET